MSGFATAESNIEVLKEPCKYISDLSSPWWIFLLLKWILTYSIAFEKFFTVNCPESISDYTKLQQQKFVILYALFVEKYKEQ